MGDFYTKLPKIDKKFLIFVIYIKICKNLVTFDTEKSEFDNVLYSLDWDLELLIKTTRPWKILTTKKDVYKISIIDEFFEVWKFEPQPKEEYDPIDSRMINLFSSAVEELTERNLLPKIQTTLSEFKLEFNCDILNVLEDLYGVSGADLISSYLSLSPDELSIIDKFYSSTTREKKLGLMRDAIDINMDNISMFLPSWCRCELKIFGKGKLSSGTEKLIPEFRNDELLVVNTDQQLRADMINEIYEEFELGSILRGSEIKTKLRNIYQKYGLNPKATIVEFMKYFVIRKAKSEYEWYYRLVRRKRDELI